MLLNNFGSVILNRCEYRNLTTQAKCYFFCDITPCTPFASKLTFRRIMSLPSSELCFLSAWRCFLAWLILHPWRWRQNVPPIRRLTFKGLHGIISQNAKLFITTAVRMSNSTNCAHTCRIITAKLMEFGATENCKHVYKICNKHDFVDVWVWLRPDRLWGPPNLLYNAYRGLFGRDVKLTTHLQLEPRSRKYGFMHPLPHTSSRPSA
jgi:hypothetical protein